MHSMIVLKERIIRMIMPGKTGISNMGPVGTILTSQDITVHI